MTGSTTFPRFKSEESRARYLAAYDAALKAWPVPFEALDLPTRFGPTRVVASGPPEAPPLVLLHSLAASAAVWRANVAALSQHFRTYAVDVIGQAGRSVATRRLRTRRDFAAWLSDVLDRLGAARAAIVGCSFGGFLALSQASLTPDRVSKVVMISPAGTFVGLSWRFALVMRTGALRRRIRRLLGDKRPPDIADLRGRAVKMDPADAGWRALMGVTMAEAPKLEVINAAVLSRRELRRIRAPALLLIGEHERLYEPRATLALAMAKMPALETELVPGADHIAAMAQPNWVNQRILRFLGEG
jgi:pimeloyl-ACP methyl ester carboxylesterase